MTWPQDRRSGLCSFLSYGSLQTRGIIVTGCERRRASAPWSACHCFGRPEARPAAEAASSPADATISVLADQTAVLKPTGYFSDGSETYRTLLYRQGQHAVAPGKSETNSVEGDNADLRHYLDHLDYLARLRRRSRCFSRSLTALARQVKLFAFCHNACQLFLQRYPKHKAQNTKLTSLIFYLSVFRHSPCCSRA